jgi:hypothetical protein
MDTADLAQESYESLLANNNAKRGSRKDKRTTAHLGDLGGILNPESILAAKPNGGDFINRVNTEIARLLETPPEPFIEPEGEKQYNTDALDGMLPKPGFLTDFVNTGRGMESPTLFFAWNALWLISTVLKREAWLRWYPNKLWPNLYVLLVAPPALCRKSSSMIIANSLLRELPNCLSSSVEAYKKTSQVITGKTTPEGLLTSLAPDQRVFLSQTETGNSMLTVDKGSQIALNISELAVFLGKQQYNSGLVTLLTDLFDCKDSDSEITRGNGLKPLRDIYVTLFGAITPDGMKTSIPDEAFGGGFMSRVVIAYQDTPTKIYPIPKPMPGYPVWQDLTFRLAWIAEHAKGEYYLTPEAEDFYSRWYRSWKQSLFSVPDNQHKDNRIDSLILRVALLMRVQEYREGNEITVENVQDAQKLLEYTSRTGEHALSNIGATSYGQSYNTIKRFFLKRGTSTRRELSQYMSSRGIKAEEISAVVDQLVVEGFLSISLNNIPMDRSANSGKEVYNLLGEVDVTD